GELAARYIAGQLYPGKTAQQLSESEKQQVSALSQLAAGLAGGLATGDTAGAVTGGQAGKNAVENNYLSSKQIDAWSAEMKSCQAGGGDCTGIIKNYEELSIAQQQQLISDCASSPTTCQKKYGNVLADSLAVKQAIDRALGEDIPIKMVYDLTATWAHQMDADGVIASNKVSEQIMAKYGLDQVQADLIAGVALSALGGVSKVGKGSGGSANSTAKLSINQGQQNKHVPGTNEYKIASEAGLNKSVLTVKPDSLLSKLGTGQQVGSTVIGVPGSKERINYGKVIGNYIDPQTGVSTPTTNGIVHYGKNGVHIVPARPSE
ncbi:VENN motif pre-toxin domain-containing protein, partial [Serratia marcescens]|uniref:VENN motif pre-toxin domain-containing protein n=1 Tax=Serratia marcescens TaxID=615 RepID=UPI00331AFD24